MKICLRLSRLGFVARRIVNYMDINLNVNQGQNLGFIKFGSE